MPFEPSYGLEGTIHKKEQAQQEMAQCLNRVVNAILI